MKKFVFFLSVLFVFSACQNMEQYKTGVADLSAKWDAANIKVTEFAAQLNSEMTNHNDMLGKMEVDQAIFTSLPAEAQTQITEAKQSCANSGNDYAELQNEIKTFLSEWEAKNTELVVLQEGIATGELSGDVAAQITSLNEFVTEGEAKLATWNSNLETVKTACSSSHSNYTAVLAQLIPAEKK